MPDSVTERIYQNSVGAVTADVVAGEIVKATPIVNVKRYGVVGDGREEDAALILEAIAATPDGGALYFPAGIYRSPDVIDRSNVTILGQAMPWFADDGLSLTNGTIFQGRTIFSGDNLTIENIGVDCGDTVADDLYAGSGVDALVVHDKDLAGLRTNVKVRNCIGLCQEGAPYHAVLLEGLQHSHFDNVHGRYGNYGVVIKAADSDACGIYGYGGDVVGVYIKSDTYAPCSRLNLTNIYADDFGALGSGTAGVSLYASTAQMERINISNVFVKGYQTGFKMVGPTRSGFPTNAMNDVSVCNVHVQGSSTYGIETYGALANCGLNGCRITGVVSNNPVYIHDDALLVTLNDISASVSSSRSDSIYLGGRVFWDNIIVVIDYDATNQSGITVAPDTTNVYSVGNYTGALTLDTSLTEGFLNGWTTFGGDTPKVTMRGKTVQVSGRISVPSSPWTGKEDAYQLPVAPLRDKNFLVGSYNMTTNSFVLVQARITAGGVLRFDGLNVSAQFPTGVAWIDLTGIIEYDVND
jgi:Endopolygalacturonase